MKCFFKIVKNHSDKNTSKDIALLFLVSFVMSNCGSFFGPFRSSGVDPRIKKPMGPSLYFVERRSISEAVEQLRPLLKDFDTLLSSQHLLLQDLAADITAQLPMANRKEIDLVKNLARESVNQNSVKQNSMLGTQNNTPPSSVMTGKKNLMFVEHPPLALSDENFEITLSPRKSVFLPARSYCLDGHLHVPYGEKVAYKATNPSEESNLRLLISYHEYSIANAGMYQSLFGDVESLDQRWNDAPDALKQIFSDLGLPAPSPDATYKEISDSTVVKEFIKQNNLVTQRLPGIDLQWFAQGYSRGKLSVYNNTDEPIAVKPSALVGRFASTYQVRPRNLALGDDGSTPQYLAPTLAPTAQAPQNTCSEAPENSAPDVQDIWAGPATPDSMPAASFESWQNTQNVLGAVETLSGRDRSIRDPLLKQAAFGADLMAIGATIAGGEIIQTVSSRAEQNLGPDKNSVLARVQALDLSKDEIDLDDFFIVVKLFASHKTSARRFADALARTQPVSEKIHSLLLSLDDVRATDAQIDQILALIKEQMNLDKSDPGNSTQLFSNRFRLLSDELGGVSHAVAYAGQSVVHYWPEVMTVLSHPSLIPDLKSMWDLQKEAHQKARDAASRCSEASRAGLEDGYFDAFRHAYWNARMSTKHGSCKAEWVGSGHEANISGGNEPHKEEMDLANNQMGRSVADKLTTDLGRAPTEDEIAIEIRVRLDRGEGKVIQKGSENDFSTWQVVPSSAGNVSCP